jgi:hypothetical protein
MGHDRMEMRLKVTCHQKSVLPPPGGPPERPRAARQSAPPPSWAARGGHPGWPPPPAEGAHPSGGLAHIERAQPLLAADYPIRGSRRRVLLIMSLRTQAHRELLAVSARARIFLLPPQRKRHPHLALQSPYCAPLPPLARPPCCSQRLFPRAPAPGLSRFNCRSTNI